MYLGDFKEDGDIYFKFTTRAFATGIPTVLAGSPVLSVYKDEGGAATEKTTAEAYFDLDVDHDSIVGYNNVRVDLSGDAFFATGADYSIVITTGTVATVSVVGETLATFSIENRSMGQPTNATLADDIASILADTTAMAGQSTSILADTTSILVDTGTTLDNKIDSILVDTTSILADTSASGSTVLMQSTTIISLVSQVSFKLTAGSADNDAYNGALAVMTDASTGTQKAQGRISDYNGADKTVTLDADPLAGWTMANSDLIDIFASDTFDAVEATSITGPLTSILADTTSILVDTGTTLENRQASILADTTSILAAGGGLTAAQNSILNSILEDTSTTLDARQQSILVDTGTTLDNQVASILVDTTSILEDTTAMGAQTTSILVDTTSILVDTGTTLSGQTTSILADTTSILADTTSILADTSTTLQNQIASILVDTSTTLDNKVDSILSVTGQFVFTKANEVDANTKSINDAEVVGDGNATPWDGA